MLPCWSKSTCRHLLASNFTLRHPIVLIFGYVPDTQFTNFWYNFQTKNIFGSRRTTLRNKMSMFWQVEMIISIVWMTLRQVESLPGNPSEVIVSARIDQLKSGYLQPGRFFYWNKINTKEVSNKRNIQQALGTIFQGDNSQWVDWMNSLDIEHDFVKLKLVYTRREGKGGPEGAFCVRWSS